GGGESGAVLGANGSGKSTALRCVVGLETPDEGSIVVSGRNVVGLKGHDLVAARRDAAMIFQQINLVRRLSALDNVCIGALARLSLPRTMIRATIPYETRSEAMSCLERAGLAERAP